MSMQWIYEQNKKIISYFLLTIRLTYFILVAPFFYSHAGFVCSINLKLKSNQTNEHWMNVEQAAVLSKSFMRLNGLSVTLNPRMFCLSGCNVCKYRPLTILTTFFYSFVTCMFYSFFSRKKDNNWVITPMSTMMRRIFCYEHWICEIKSVSTTNLTRLMRFWWNFDEIFQLILRNLHMSIGTEITKNDKISMT